VFENDLVELDAAETLAAAEANPVLPAGHLPVDDYEIPAALREQLQLRNPADVFPYAAAISCRLAETIWHAASPPQHLAS
jgi:hypothetical protein